MLEQVDFNTNFYNVMQVFHIDVFYCIHAHKAIDFIIYIYIYCFITMIKVRELFMLLVLIIVSS